MIRVTCAECGEIFEIGEEFAGLTEFCPFCGALSDIPSPEDEAPELLPEEFQPGVSDQPILPDPSELVFSPVPSGGVPSPIWWALIISGVSIFIAACFFLFSDNWEMRNLQSLNDAANRGDVLMVDQDFPGAAAQYRYVLDTVGSREIDSIYIRQIVERARRGAAQAAAEETQAQLHPNPAATTATTAPTAATQPDDLKAIKSFQRDSEAFPLFVRNHSMDFQDDKSHWRRRQFTVWDVTYERQPDADRPRVLLSYSFASRITEPHDNRRQADNDGDFMNDEYPSTVHCQTLFELFAGQWIILHQDVDAGAKSHPTFDDFYEIERQAFHAAIIPQ